MNTRATAMCRLVLLMLALARPQATLASGRGLQQADTVTYISSPADLVAALGRGDPHIQILQHLDFKGFSPKLVGNDFGNTATLLVGSTVRSIRGNCAGKLPLLAELSLDTSGPDLWPQKPGQCLLSGFSGQAMYVGAPEGFPIWLDNIYLRQGDGATHTGFIMDISRWSETAPIAAATSAWVTNITVQGNAKSLVFGMSVDSRTYVEDGLFTHLDDPATALLVSGQGSTAALKNCEFSSISSPAAPLMIVGLDRGLSGIQLQGTTYTDTSQVAHVTAWNNTEVYADGRETVARLEHDGVQEIGGLEDPEPPSGVENSTLQFLSRDDSEVRQLIWEEQAARDRTPLPGQAAAAPGAAEAATSTSISLADSASAEDSSAASQHGDASCSGNSQQEGCSSSESTHEQSTWLIVSMVACIVAAVAVALLAFVFCCKCRKGESKVQGGTASMDASLRNNTVTNPYGPHPHSLVEAGSFGSAYSPGHPMQVYDPKNPHFTPFLHHFPVDPATNSPFPFFNPPPRSGASQENPPRQSPARKRQSPPEYTAQHSPQCTTPYVVNKQGYIYRHAAGVHKTGASSSDASSHAVNACAPPIIPESSSESMYGPSKHATNSPNLSVPPFAGILPESSMASASIHEAHAHVPVRHVLQPAMPLTASPQISPQLSYERKLPENPNAATYTSYDSLLHTGTFVLHSDTFSQQSLRPPTSSDPASSAYLERQQAFVNKQLDSLLSKEVLAGLVVLPGSKNRLNGGEAVVQLVEQRITRQDFAIKLFLTKGSFEQEKRLYLDPNMPLGKFLPKLRMIVESPEGGFVDGSGNAMPSCIVMEKGEALDTWVRRSESGIDMVTGVQVLTHIAERLKDLHAAGYVHRDLKPGNIMWLPRQNHWTLIDFGCAARTGERAPLGFTLNYAAPEVIREYQAGGKGMVVSESVDAWSLGVLAIELFTGQHAFDPLTPLDDVKAMIVGDKQAPWEDPATSDKILSNLGFFRRLVLPLLERDPSKRPSMADAELSCRAILSDAPASSRSIA